MSIQEKQQYLRVEIVQKGYDANAFYEFWQSFRLQIQEVKIQVLMDIVDQFKQKQIVHKAEDKDDDEFGEYQTAQQNQNFYKNINWDFLAQPITSESKKSIEESPKKLISPKQEGNLISISSKGIPLNEESLMSSNQSPKKIDESLITNKDFNVTLKQVFTQSKVVKKKCLKLQPNILDHHINVQIFIKKWEEIQDESSNIINKLWKGKDIIFTIKTLARNKQRVVGVTWEVKRRHADFEWLRTMLAKFYPGLIVPPLPSSIKSSEKLAGYLRKLQSFLLDCYYCPELKNSKYFEVFLSYASVNDFENFKKNCENNSKPKSLGHILNMKGEIQLMFGQKIDNYTAGLQQFLTKSSHHLKKYHINLFSVKSIIHQINELYENISHKYKELSQVFRIMSEQSCSFSEEQCYPRLTETYKQIASLTDHHSDSCLNEKQFIETFMLSQFAYQKDRIDNIQNLIGKRKNFCSQLAKPKHQNEGQKGDSSMFDKFTGLFGDRSESVEIPSNQTQTLKEQVGFYNSQLMKESVRTVERMISSHVNHFSLYGHSRIDNVDAMQKIWSEIMVELSKLHSR